jgi:DNA-binding response OmpR family regulator
MSRRVLLVDDDLEIREFLAVLLETEGFDPVPVARASEALAAAEKSELSAVLLDIAMPDLDGLDLCRRLRAQGFRAPILVISARPGAELARKAHEAGADDFVRKPFENADLLEKIRALIGRNGETGAKDGRS